MKSGTTYLQGALYTNRDKLREQGVLVPGERWRNQIDAVLDVRGRVHHPGGDSVGGAWDRLVGEVNAWDGTAVISVELLAPVHPEVVEKVAASFDGVTPDIVLSVRDLNRGIPAMWQELIQNGMTWGWADFVKGVRRSRPERPRPDELAHRFWDEQDQVGIARRWGRVGPVHLVTVPPPGAPPTALLERFGEAMGFDPTGLASPPPRNTSLGAATAEALRALNVELAERGLRWPAAIQLRKHRLAKQLLPALGVEDPRIGLRVPRWVRAYTRDQQAGFGEMDCTVHGDLADLEPVDVAGIDAAHVSDEQVRDAAVAAYGALRADLAKQGEVAAELPESVAAGRGRSGVAAAVKGLADLVEWSERREPAHA